VALWVLSVALAWSWEGWGAPGIDLCQCALTWIIVWRFKAWESWLYLMLAYVAQASMLHSGDLLSFYVCLEGQNLGMLVLLGARCVSTGGLQASGAAAAASSATAYLLTSAFSSGLCLYGLSGMYAHTGGLQPAVGGRHFWILLALLFKLHAAPIHTWVVHLYVSLPKPLLAYLATAPKLSVFCFWVSTWHQLWTDLGVSLFVAACMCLGSLGAYAQPALRAVFVYSTVNEMGVMLCLGSLGAYAQPALRAVATLDFSRQEFMMVLPLLIGVLWLGGPHQAG
jgi:NADH:ubiquinone oxidoreductase subunit 2 (subunit N)